MTIINISDRWRINRLDEVNYCPEKKRTGIAKTGPNKGNEMNSWERKAFFNTLPQALCYVLGNIIESDKDKYIEIKDVLTEYQSIRDTILEAANATNS